MRKYWVAIVAAILALAFVGFGGGLVFMGVSGKNEVKAGLAAEKIHFPNNSEDPVLVKVVPKKLWGTQVDTPAEAKMMRNVIRGHTLEATEGKVYAEMGRFLDAKGHDTSDPAAAAKDENGQPVVNKARDIWVTSTAWQTALNQAYMAWKIADFVTYLGVFFLVVGALFGTLVFFAKRLTR